MGQFIRRLWEIAKPFRRQLATMLVLLALQDSALLAGPYCIGKTINLLSAGAAFKTLAIAAPLWLAARTTELCFSCLRERYEAKNIDYEFFNYIADMTIAASTSLSIGQHTQQNSAKRKGVFDKGQDALKQLFQVIFYDIAPSLLRSAIIIGLLLIWNPILGGIIAAGIAAFIVWCILMNVRLRKPLSLHHDLFNKNVKNVSELLRNITLVIRHAQEERMRKECSAQWNEFAEDGKRIWLPFINTAHARHYVLDVTAFLALLVGIWQVRQGTLSSGGLITFTWWSSSILSDVSRFGRLNRQMIELSVQVKKLFRLFDLKPNVNMAENPIKPLEWRGDIEFKGVTFSYPPMPKKSADEEDEDSATETKDKETVARPVALSDVSFSIRQGETIALVGPSGSGKSTILGMMFRAFDPDSGTILIDGHDLRNLDMRSLRESIGSVEQDVMMWDGTIGKNLTFGLNGRSGQVTKEELDRVSELSGISLFKKRLTEGYDTEVGERGIQLSGGERQRVGIGRAVIKNPAIYIFDEATSSLDALNERLIRDSIRKVSAGRTTIIVAHRLSTVIHADRIIVMNQGKVVSEGKHSELLEKCPLYKELVENQMFVG